MFPAYVPSTSLLHPTPWDECMCELGTQGQKSKSTKVDHVEGIFTKLPESILGLQFGRGSLVPEWLLFSAKFLRPEVNYSVST